MEYIRTLRTGIMAEYPVMSTSQGTYVRIEQTSEAIRVTYEICGARGLELRTAAVNTIITISFITFWPFFPLIHIQVHLCQNRADSTKFPICRRSRTPQDCCNPGCHHCHLHCHFWSLSSGGRLQICHPASHRK